MTTNGLRNKSILVTPSDPATTAATSKQKHAKWQPVTLWDTLFSSYGSVLLSYRQTNELLFLRLANYPRPMSTAPFLHSFCTVERLNNPIVTPQALLAILREVGRIKLWKSSAKSSKNGILTVLRESKIIVLENHGSGGGSGGGSTNSRRVCCSDVVDPNDKLFQQIIGHEQQQQHPEEKQQVENCEHQVLITLPWLYASDPLVTQTLRKAGMASLLTFHCYERAAHIVEIDEDPIRGTGNNHKTAKQNK